MFLLNENSFQLMIFCGLRSYRLWYMDQDFSMHFDPRKDFSLLQLLVEPFMVSILFKIVSFHLSLFVLMVSYQFIAKFDPK
jgi:hypothetical protein